MQSVSVSVNRRNCSKTSTGRSPGGMDTSLQWMIVVSRKVFTSGHRTVGGEEEHRNNHGRTK